MATAVLPAVAGAGAIGPPPGTAGSGGSGKGGAEGGQPTTATQAKISALREKFAGFQTQWEVETRSRIDRDGSRLDGVKESMAKLEQTLNSEIKRRVEANKAMQAMFESQIASIQDRLEAIFVDRLDKLQYSVDALNDRMSTVEREFTLTREQYIQDIEDKNAVVAKDTNGMQNAFENEKIDRRERELAISKKLGDHEARTQSALEAQGLKREQKYQMLRGELEDIKRVRDKGDDKFQTFILEEVAAVKNGLVAESHAREQADDDIVQALNHYTKCLQDALRIINQH
eukprot:TRINITY_DN4812_c0_g1_i3.p2 TRINITY_DN4812_c0_g1~~TRINITY_DN4812_c0_g1_i3.p2  ORF type:complete len:329 (-),score=85.88 TRINITY_DN4812_c0_g1_i3:1105-1965(-)